MTSKIKTSKKELASEKIKSLLAKAKEKREMAKGGKIKEVDFENSNLILYGFGKDTNGNSIVKIGFPNQRTFSIQTNNIGLETSHNKRGYAVHELDQKEIDSIEKEVVEYLKENGTKEQKAKLKTYSTYSDGGEISEYEVIINKGSKNERVLADFATKKIAENFVYDYGLKHPKAKLSICKVDEKSHKMSGGGMMAKGGEVDEESHYFKNIVKRNLLELKEDIKNSKNTRESEFYKNRFDVQLRDYARGLGISENELKNKLSNQYAKGGRVGKDTYLNPPENPSYMISRDAQRSERAKPSGWRYTNAGAKRLKIDNTKAYPSKEHIEKYKGKYFTDRDGVEHRYIYIERRADKADMRRGKPYLERGGGIPNNYEGKTARTIWNEWELSQRKHFLEDHNVNPKGIIALNWEQLSDNHEDVIRKINEHIHEGEYKHGGEIEDNYNEDDTFHKGDKINKKTTGEKAEVIHLNTGGNHLLESYLVRKDNGETAYWWASDMEICYECGGRMERGGSIESQNKEIEEDEIGENINVFGYQTEHFINCPKAVSEFKKAIEEIITSYAVDSVEYTKESEALNKAARELDVILRLEEIIGEDKEHLTIDTVKTLNTALKLFYIYNYKSGLRIESDFIAQHLYNIFDVEGEKYLEYEEGGSIESQNKEMVSIKAKEIKHHANELMESLKGDEEVPAWVVAKIERSATDISDAAHYLEGVENEEFERGGEIGIDDKNIEEGYHKTMVTKFNTYYTDDSDGIIMYRNQDGHKFGGGAMVEGEFIDDILNDRAIWINEDDKENIELIKEEQSENVGIEDNEPFAKGGLLNSAKSLLNKTKESVKSGYNKSKKYTEQKIHDKKRDIAYNVLQSTRNKVRDKKESQILKEASNIVDANYEKGGTTFKDKVSAITNRLNGTKVKPKYKKEYGSTYDKKEAKEAATKIAGKMIRREKMSNGGKITNEEWIKIEPVISKTYDYIIQVSAVQKRLLSAKDLWGDGTIFKPLTFKQFEVVHRNIKEITTDNPNFKW